jgi:pyrroline-5-carboxylate reductase
MQNDGKIGILGCGNMGEAIAKGMIFSGLVSARNLYVYDVDRDKVARLRDYLDANTANTSEELANQCDIIILAIKPQDIDDALKEIQHVMDASKLLVSIAAGTSIQHIKKFLKEEIRIIRAMPNMAAFVSAGVTAICSDDYATDEDMKFVKQFFMAIGDVVEVKEDLMDAVTAISGSGPAYFFYLAEMLERCAIEMGIDNDKAKLLAVKTAVGSALLLLDGDASAEALRRRVTSKGGTTEAAFRYFAEKGLDDVIRGGLDAARKRAKELSER